MQNFRCVLATDLHPVRMTRAPLQPTCAQRTHSVSFLQFFPLSLALQTAYLARAWSVRGPCVVRAYSALPKFNCPMSRQNSRGPYRVSTCSALTTHLFGVRATYLQLAQPCAWRAFTYSLSALATPSLRFQKKTWRAWPPQKTYGKKKRRMGCARGFTLTLLWRQVWIHVQCISLCDTRFIIALDISGIRY